MPGKGKFARCVESVASRGGVSDPRAVCAKSIAAKRGRTRGRVNPWPFGDYYVFQFSDGTWRIAPYTNHTGPAISWDVLDGVYNSEKDAIAALRSAKKRNTPSYALVQAAAGAGESSGREWPKVGKYGRGPTTTSMDKEFKDWLAYRANSMPEIQTLTSAQKKQLRGVFFRGIRQGYRANPKRYGVKDAAKLARAAARGIPAVYAAEVFTNPKARKNPHSERAAVERFTEFHGEPPTELIEFDSQHHFPGRTAALGDLVKLKIKLPKDRRVPGGQIVTLKNFKQAWLTQHPTMKQLYVEGGDQSVDLEEFGLDARDPHELEYLGELTECVYFTRKVHLGKDGGTANYEHKFGKRELGEHEVELDKTELIKVGFHVPDEQLILMGGGYAIPPEGIDG